MTTVRAAGSVPRMDPSPWPARLRRLVVALLALAAVVFIAGSWHFSNVLDRDLLIPQPFEPERGLQVLSVGEGRIVLPRTESTETDGTWGLDGETAYGRVGPITDLGTDDVEREFTTIEGRFEVGDPVAFDQYAYAGDPFTAHALPFEEVRVAGDTGVLPAWYVGADRDTWVIFVHGKGLDERRQVLRILPVLHELDLPVLAISYRNDANTQPDPSGRYGWGLSEWRDVQAALEYADLRGADDFILMGMSMGGAVTAGYLHEGDSETDHDLAGRIRGVIWDSPVLDLEAVVDAAAEERGIPGVLTSVAKTLARLRFDVDWDRLDQIARADQFDPRIPILLLHGTEDGLVPVAGSDAFAAAVPTVTYERFEGADHVYLWNSDSQRYEQAVVDFLESVLDA